MKRTIAFALTLVCLLGLLGCSSAAEKGLLLETEGVKSVSVSSLPEGYEYSFSGDDATAVVDYLVNLNLTPYSKTYFDVTGMAWVICIEYENGDAVRVCHNCNEFIRADDGPWYQMTYEEASRFDSLLNELSK